MFWADRFAEKIIKSSKYKPYHVDDMKTPSGRVHVGALRGVVVHYLIYRALKEQGKDAVYTFVINDMDPMDGFPHYLPEKFKKHMGKPLFKIPSPEKGYKSMAQAYAGEFIDVFNKLGMKPKIIWSSEWYEQGRFNDVIVEALEKKKKIRKLYEEISDYDKPKNWYPFQVICPKCGKVGTTQVNGWDGKKVSFECKGDLVDWAKGCGYKGKISPFNGTGKLMWKVDWAAHWKVIGVTVEGAGKDHMTEGGSYDLSSAICEQVFEYPKPFAFLYEWFLAKGGSKMSSSKGIGVSAKEISDMLPAELLRFLLIKTPYKTAIIFDPNSNQTVLKLFDEYDRYAKDYYSKKSTDYGKIWKLSQIGEIPEKEPFLPRFRDVANYIQLPSVDIEKKFEEIKGNKLTKTERAILAKRVKYAKIWLKNYAPDEMVYEVSDKMPDKAKKLSEEQKKYLLKVANLIGQKKWKAEELQQELYNTAKEMKLSVKKAFQAIYIALLGKTHGPKAGWLIVDNDKDFIIKRFKEVGND